MSTRLTTDCFIDREMLRFAADPAQVRREEIAGEVMGMCLYAMRHGMIGVAKPIVGKRRQLKQFERYKIFLDCEPWDGLAEPVKRLAELVAEYETQGFSLAAAAKTIILCAPGPILQQRKES